MLQQGGGGGTVVTQEQYRWWHPTTVRNVMYCSVATKEQYIDYNILPLPVASDFGQFDQISVNCWLTDVATN